MIGTVTATRLNVRAMPNVQGRKLGELPQGTVVDVIGTTSGWFEILYQGFPAFVSDDYVDLQDHPPRLTGLVTASVLNVRDRPSGDGLVLGTLTSDTRIDILSQIGNWLEIQFQQGTGYVSKNYVQIHVLQGMRRGIVEANVLNIRSKPTTDAPTLGQLQSGTEIVIESSIENWHEIVFNGARGYVSADYIRISEVTDEEPDISVADNELQETLPQAQPSETAEGNELVPARLLGVGGSSEERKVAETWNRYGGLLTRLRDDKQIDTACSVAVLCVESSGKGFEQNNLNRMIIRFENHKFWKYWGKNDPARFNQHFLYDSAKVWKGHRWRPNPAEDWRSFHGSQRAEWEALTFARSIDNDAALMSISMGAPQIMGFHFERLGYRSVQEMFDDFSKDIGAQIKGLFDFLSDAMVQKLQRQDFVGFAGLYNGSGQKEKYGRWIKSHFDAFKRLAS